MLRIAFPGAVLVIAALFACSGEIASSPASRTGILKASVQDPISGVADPNDDPAVVAVEIEGTTICAGALIAPDVVLTALHCVLLPSSPALSSCDSVGAAALRDPALFGVRVGAGITPADLRAHGQRILVPADAGLCEADIAVLLLDAAIDDVVPLAVRSTGVAQGDHVRTVGFGHRSGERPTKIVRDHVSVVQTSATAFRLREAACEYGCSGPVVDESTSEIVGVLSGPAALGGPGESDGGADSPWDIGTRADAFLVLVQRALAEGAPIVATGRRAKTKKGPIDMGANCESAPNCAAGVCVTDGARQYCSRTCGVHDRCPARFRCERSGGPSGQIAACVES